MPAWLEEIIKLAQKKDLVPRAHVTRLPMCGAAAIRFSPDLRHYASKSLSERSRKEHQAAHQNEGRQAAKPWRLIANCYLLCPTILLIGHQLRSHSACL